MVSKNREERIRRRRVRRALRDASFIWRVGSGVLHQLSADLRRYSKESGLIKKDIEPHTFENRIAQVEGRRIAMRAGFENGRPFSSPERR